MNDQLQDVLDGQIGKFWPFEGRFSGELLELHGYARKLDSDTIQLEALDERDHLTAHRQTKQRYQALLLAQLHHQASYSLSAEESLRAPFPDVLRWTGLTNEVDALLEVIGGLLPVGHPGHPRPPICLMMKARRGASTILPCVKQKQQADKNYERPYTTHCVLC